MDKPLVEIEIECEGPIAFHNMPCPVCGNRHAVLQMNIGVFGPCTSCESQGWSTGKPVTLLDHILGRCRKWGMK